MDVTDALAFENEWRHYSVDRFDVFFRNSLTFSGPRPISPGSILGVDAIVITFFPIAFAFVFAIVAHKREMAQFGAIGRLETSMIYPLMDGDSHPFAMVVFHAMDARMPSVTDSKIVLQFSIDCRTVLFKDFARFLPG